MNAPDSGPRPPHGILRRIDLNLLVTLDTLLRERHVTRTAQALNLAQPTVSMQLARLRELLDDPPYWDCETMYGKGIFAKDDFERLAEQLRHIKGRFLLSINDVPAIREIFAGFQFKEVSLRYSINKEATTKADELLIANYPINTE